ncbi:hypothetical protein NHX12_002936 [Muraenolepis orangiensis]|uniref:LIM zinc-binding domain-containing protein n=1 Tax=Muraenolepis orangiensis TaxID=630683 RepID=A0A9Q0IFN0_9TELE|nr:hypothetical protein NHX12_002936 [Muraenolepis orangiensis]
MSQQTPGDKDARLWGSSGGRIEKNRVPPLILQAVGSRSTGASSEDSLSSLRIGLLSHRIGATMVLDKEESVSLVSLRSREKPRGCAGCQGQILDRFMLQALDRFWHEDCLKCACCDCRLGQQGTSLYTRANLILCRRDYLR